MLHELAKLKKEIVYCWR